MTMSLESAKVTVCAAHTPEPGEQRMKLEWRRNTSSLELRLTARQSDFFARHTHTHHSLSLMF